MSIFKSGLVGPQGPQGEKGDAGSPGGIGPAGPAGSVGPAGALVYGSSGAISNAKIWKGTATTNSSGQFTADYSAAGFTVAPAVQATVIGSGSTAGDAKNASWTAAPGLNSATGIVTAASGAVLGLIPIQLVGAGVIVHVIAVGN